MVILYLLLIILVDQPPPHPHNQLLSSAISIKSPRLVSDGSTQPYPRMVSFYVSDLLFFKFDKDSINSHFLLFTFSATDYANDIDFKHLSLSLSLTHKHISTQVHTHTLINACLHALTHSCTHARTHSRNLSLSICLPPSLLLFFSLFSFQKT